MSRVLAFLYSVVCYVLFLGIFLYAIGFVGNLFVPRSVDNALVSTTGMALLINALLLGLFAIQHSVMARVGFKRMWTKIVPKPIERSTFVLFTCIVMALMFWQWRTIPGDIWLVENNIGKMALQSLFWMGWLTVLLATFMINHFELFGLRQGWMYLTGKQDKPQTFQTTGFYSFVRHPIMFGFVIAMWGTPHMTLGHLVFAIGTTGYILVGIMFEERDLVAAIGRDYIEYRQRVSMIIPWIPKKKSSGKRSGSQVVDRPDATI